MPDVEARTQAFWAEVFNEHDLSAARGFVAPGFVNRDARPGTPAGPEGARPRPDLRRDRPHH